MRAWEEGHYKLHAWFILRLSGSCLSARFQRVSVSTVMVILDRVLFPSAARLPLYFYWYTAYDVGPGGWSVGVPMPHPCTKMTFQGSLLLAPFTNSTPRNVK